MNALRTIFRFQRRARARDASGRLAQPIINKIRLMSPVNDSAGAAVVSGLAAALQTGGAIANPVRPTFCNVDGPVIVPILLSIPTGEIVARLLQVSAGGDVGGMS